MKRTERRNKFLKHKTSESWQAFVKQRNYVSLFYGNQKGSIKAMLMCRALLTIRNSGKLKSLFSR